MTAALIPLMIGPEPLGGGIGIINEQTGALIVSPPLEDAFSVMVPGLEERMLEDEPADDDSVTGPPRTCRPARGFRAARVSTYDNFVLTREVA